MYNFEYLDKSKKHDILPLLFDIIYENLKEIAPSDLSYDEEKAEFINEVGIALEKEPRKMILCYCKGELAGFLMYYTRENLLMVEEVQIIGKHQKTMAFYRLCSFLLSNLPENIETIEAFADIRNVPSIRLQKSLGMRKTESHDLQLYHFVGDAKKIRKRFERG
ncbi:MAG: hypothetical protein IKA84_02850 [Clostridia bacterium]|nr:hypothetical protein [Clostridia bacterium]